MEENYNIWDPLADYYLQSKEEINEKTSLRFSELLKIYDSLAEAQARYNSTINRLMKERSIEKIYQIITEPDFELCCQIDHVFNVFYMFAQIAYLEKKYMNNCILDKAFDMNGLCEYGQKIIFGLRRLEFDWESDTVTPFMEWLLAEQISYVVLAELIAQRLFVNKKIICKKLFRFYSKNGYKMECAKLFFILAKRHNEENLYVDLVQVLLDEEELRLAYELLTELEHPSVGVEEIIHSLKKRLFQDGR